MTALATSLMQTACTSERRAPAAVALEAEAPDLVLHRARFDRLVEGRVVASGQADELRYHRGDQHFEADSAWARVIPAAGSPADTRFGAVRLEAPEVSGELREKSARAEHGATLAGERGDTLKAPRVDLDGPAGMLSASGGVVCGGSQFNLTAESVSAPVEGHTVDFVQVRGRAQWGSPAGRQRGAR